MSARGASVVGVRWTRGAKMQASFRGTISTCLCIRFACVAPRGREHREGSRLGVSNAIPGTLWRIRVTPKFRGRYLPRGATSCIGATPPRAVAVPPQSNTPSVREVHTKLVRWAGLLLPLQSQPGLVPSFRLTPPAAHNGVSASWIEAQRPASGVPCVVSGVCGALFAAKRKGCAPPVRQGVTAARCRGFLCRFG